MKKPIFPRIMLFILLYFAVFTVLVFIQFSRQDSFTRMVGLFVVSGQQRYPDAGEDQPGPGEFLLGGNSHVFFGGIDFSLVLDGDENSLMLAMEDGSKEKVVPERMTVSEESVIFTFPGGTELVFSSQYSGETILMLISGVFQGDVSGIELPFKLLKKSGIKSTEEQFIVSSDGVDYTFDRSPMDAEARMLFIRSGGTPVSYRTVPERKGFSHDEFILPQALSEAGYNEAIVRWRDQNFSVWNRSILDQTNEDVVISFIGEAFARGTYRASVASIPGSFLRSSNRTFESSAFLGGLDQASRSISAREREKNNRLSRLISEKSLEFLKEQNVIQYFAARGQLYYIDAGAVLIRAIDPAILALDILPGIFEGYNDWRAYRPNAENPFERIIEQSFFVISESLKKTTTESGTLIYVSADDNGMDAEFNLRLGKALLKYADTIMDSDWTGIGRSLVLSALTAEDVSSARLYRILNPLANYPRSLPIVASNNIWAWTTAQSVSGVLQSDMLDINVRFPVGETHYMLIRGIRPFSRVQLYNIDFRTDPQFERYDSSGWAYYSQEQILLVKMRHRVTEERIRIIFRDTSAPSPAQAGSETQPAVSQ